MKQTQTVVFVHGLGEAPGSWDRQIELLPDGFTGLAVDVYGLLRSREQSFSFEAAADAIKTELDRHELSKVHLCGLSLGAMIALQISLDSPARVASLTLAAGQVKPPAALMGLQKLVMQILPERLVAMEGVSKATVLDTVRAAGRADFSERLAELAVPTLVLCGSKDRANLPASRSLSAGIPGAIFRLIPGAGHQSQLDKPTECADALGGFLAGTSS